MKRGGELRDSGGRTRAGGSRFKVQSSEFRVEHGEQKKESPHLPSADAGHQGEGSGRADFTARLKSCPPEELGGGKNPGTDTTVPDFEPVVGQPYLVWGTYLHDADHGWNELHPITSMQPMETVFE